MANEGRERAVAALGKGTANARCTFKTSDLEELKGKYDTVTCVDVMIHYPSDKVRATHARSSNHCRHRHLLKSINQP